MADQKIKLPWRVNGFIDRHGKPRYLLRLPGQPSIPLPGLPWSPPFMAAYDAAVAGQPIPAAKLPLIIGADRTKPGTLNDAIVRFYQHPLFTNVGRWTQKEQRTSLEKFRQEKTAADVPRGELQLHTLNHETLAAILNGISSPHAQRHLLKALRALMKFCKVAGLIKTDPTAELKAKRAPKTGGFKPGSETDVAQYQAQHPLGSMPRLALEIMLNTGLRRCDAVVFGRQHVSDGVMRLRPSKTRNSTGIEVVVPIHSELQAAIDAMPPRRADDGTAPLAYLLTSHGKPFTVAGFGNWFRDQCVAAGVAFRAHGLRKSIVIRLVRQGMAPHQIAAITGHKDLREIQLYADEYNREVAAQQAMAALENRKAVGGSNK